VGGVLTGLAESLLLLARAYGKFTASAELPASFLLGAVGRFVVTHFLFWLAVGALYSLPMAAWLSRRSGSRPALAPEGLSLGIFILLAGAVVIPADLSLFGRLDPVYMVVLLLGILTAGVALFFAAWWASHRRWFAVYRAGLKWGGLGCPLIALASAVAMYRSPFCGADAYRVPDIEAGPMGRAQERPNILWIVLDTVRADHMSCYGYPRQTTPFLDRLAAESVVYTKAIANANWTVPSHASMFTGLAERQHGASRKHAWLDDKHLTIAELLSDNGYMTASFSNNPHVSVGRNFTQGFQFHPQVFLLTWLDKMSLKVWCEWLGLAPPLPWLEEDLGGEHATAYLAWWLDNDSASPLRADKPWLMFFNFMEAHLPYPAPRRYRRMFLDAEQVRRSYALRRQAYGNLIFAIHYLFNLRGNEAIAPADREVLAGLYDASIRYLDRRIEELFGILDQRGLLDNTAVIITADHGESLGEHGWWEHAYGVYNTVAHVPLIVRYPGGGRPQRLDYPVQPSDLFPTVAALAGVQAPILEGRRGRDLARMSQANTAERVVVAEYLTPWLLPVLWAQTNVPGFQKGPVVRQLRGAVWGHYKLIWSSDGRHELYDLRADPLETRNLAEDAPGLVALVQDKLARWVGSVPEYEPTGELVPDLPREVAQQLRALGYIQ
jgi:arylsulfatase A-like enzyme